LKKILLLSAYDAVSHRVWRETLVDGLPEFRWSVLALPPRYFSWRIRGNALSWLRQPALDENYDLVVATSMSDLAGLKGLRRELSGTPAIVYFHENQFDYPAGQGKQGVEAQMVTLYSALAADKVAFNSSYNMEGFLQGVRSLLGRLPDCVPKGVVSRIADRSCVIPVPIRGRFYCKRRAGGGSRPITIVWNHRWEHDKGPDRLLALAGLVVRSGLEVRFRITGQQFRRTPGAFDRIRDLLGDRIVSWGHIDDSDYPRILQESDVVLSTALHDFQGLAVLEAVAAGCVPLVPDRLAYPEWFAEEFRYSSNPEDPQAEAQNAMDRLAEYADSFRGPRMCPPDVSWLSWEKLRSRYLELLSF
jgi:glycosyltransferase involved in cell wall biosynthesis